MDEELIRKRAYCIWLSGGQVDGSDKQNWYQAEQELAAEQDQPEEPTVPTPPDAPPPVITTPVVKPGGDVPPPTLPDVPPVVVPTLPGTPGAPIVSVDE